MRIKFKRHHNFPMALKIRLKNLYISWFGTHRPFQLHHLSPFPPPPHSAFIHNLLVSGMHLSLFHSGLLNMWFTQCRALFPQHLWLRLLRSHACFFFFFVGRGTPGLQDFLSCCASSPFFSICISHGNVSFSHRNVKM